MPAHQPTSRLQCFLCSAGVRWINGANLAAGGGLETTLQFACVPDQHHLVSSAGDRGEQGVGQYGLALALAPQRGQPRTMPCPVGPGAVMPVNRMNAVMLMAIAPITEKIICQVADGIAIWAMPSVAL